MFAEKNVIESIKLIDFGLSAEFAPENAAPSLTRKCGTFIYLAPEVLLDKRYGKVFADFAANNCA
jgi:serine/threonine protein kinase